MKTVSNHRVSTNRSALTNIVTCDDIARFLPHDEPMILLDKLLDVSDKAITISVDLSKPSLFSDEQGRVPSYLGIEYMAQSIGALVGFHQAEAGEAIRLGFLLGTRFYKCEQSYFEPSQTLIVQVAEYMQDGILGVYDCQILINGTLAATAQIKAIQPESIEQLSGK